MLTTKERALAREDVAIRRVQRLAWLVLLTSFMIFCLITTAGGVLVYRWWASPAPAPIMVELQQPLAVQVQPAGMVQLELLQGGRLHPGDRLIVSEEATPGRAAVLRFADAALAVWPGTTLDVGTFGAQWNDPSGANARFTLESGQIVVELQGERTRLQVDIGGGLGGPPVVLESPGRYLLRILDEKSPTTALAERRLGRGLEVATDVGTARVGDTDVQRGMRLVEIGARGVPQQVPARTRWSLIRDGTFQQLVESELGHVANAELVWRRTSEQVVEGEERSGQVQPTQACLDPIRRTDCEAPYVRLVRKGGNTRGYVTAIAQTVDADVAAYRSVTLAARINIVSHSLSKAGLSGTECPLLIRVTYTNHVAQNVQKDFCFWAFEYPDQHGTISTLPYIETRRIPPGVWYPFTVDLKRDLPQLAEIREISFQANGHDYESLISDVQLYAEGLEPVVAP
ncbi:hypothetical protein [Kallotenue papyrolyticum]|uniref:hypothetical protein n=1 Tax=Kallotenue papyrolyticum TaxID=1325125 RepID=UPI000478527E|nr:hypothetical protein [Kallotenue papyrolyticum]